MFFLSKGIDKSIIKDYKKELPSLILMHYKYFLPVVIAILLIFTVSDIYIRKIPELSYTRILPLILSTSLFIIGFLPKIANKRIVVVLNNLFALSLFLMSILMILIIINTELVSTGLNVLIIIIATKFFIVKGKGSIFLVYAISLLFAIPFVSKFACVKPDQLYNLVNIAVVFIGSMVACLLSENSRFKEFYYKSKLQAEKEKTQELYYETLVQNAELHTQKTEVTEVNSELKQKSTQLQINLEVISDLNERLKKHNKDVIDSINYASRIQKGLLPSQEELNNFFSAYSVYYKPCDIVSGDFYWINNLDGRKVIAVADCTGHGVAGAFMSILAISLLNEITAEHKQIIAGEILNKLRAKVIEALKQNESEYTALDGLDIGICIVDKEQEKLSFAGAYHNLHIFRKKTLNIIKADTMTIGKTWLEKSAFSTQEYSIVGDETFYMFSDGFQDQFGGKNKKKYVSTNVKKFLSGISHLPMRLQQEHIENEFLVWKGREKQVDDVLVFGFKL